MPKWIWSLLALVAFLVLLKRIITLLILARLRLRLVAYRKLSEADVGAWERELLQGAEGVLAAQGFRFAGYAHMPDPVPGRSEGHAMAFYQHASEPVWASVAPAEIPIPQCPFQINYVSCFTNGRLLYTISKRERLLPPGVDYVAYGEVDAADFDAIFAGHRQAAEEMGRAAPAERIGLEALLFLGDKLLADELESLRARGFLAETREGAYRLTLRGLFAANRTTAATAPAGARMQKAWAAREATFPLPARAEAEAYLRLDALGPRVGNYGKAVLILASLAAFSMLSAGGFSWFSGAMLLAIIFVHEMGHALAMRWVGYRDVNVFFIPFFGAVATGRQETHTGAWKEAFILLAGPVPGLAAGLAALWAGGSHMPEWASQAAYTAVFVNAFNLLPIAPLDGGQLMQLILFRRFPRLNKVFMVLSAFAVGAVAWWAESPLLGFFALVLLWGLYKGSQGEPREAELAGIRARYGNGRDSSGRWDAGMIAEFFGTLREGKAAHFLDKVTQIKGFLAAPVQGRTAPAGALAALTLFAAYACILALPLAWYAFPMLGAFLYRGETVVREDLQPAQARVYDGLCGDTAVYQIGMYSARDTLYLYASVIAPGDTGRVGDLAKQLAGREAMQVSVRSPIWGFGGLDSTLPIAMRGTGETEEEEDYEYQDSVTEARYLALDSLGRKAWDDSAEAAGVAMMRRLDSLRKVEEAIWESWPAERRKEWLAQWKKKRARLGGETLACFKG